MAAKSVIKEKKAEIVSKFGKTATNTGSTEVQVALLTTRIKELTEHFRANANDNHGRRGLLGLVGQRKRLLSYLKVKDAKRYGALIQTLELRK
ncbi:MAG: 30S ribosomal protein S15 [Proteobacteria bacterium]|nr:MAG: 30S ribosomal protein S15 [Pseudomonadota bacterium]